MRSLRFILCIQLVGLMVLPEAMAQPFVGGLKRLKSRGDISIGSKLLVSDAEMARLPHAVSYESFSPSAGNQNGKATTVAYATAYYLRTILENQARDIRQPEAVNANRFSAEYLYNQIKSKDDVDCSSGVDMESALKTLQTQGVPLLKTTGVQGCNPSLTESVVAEAARYRIGEYTILFGPNDSPINKLRLLKKTLAQGMPAVIEFNAPESFTVARKVWVRAANETLDMAVYPLALCVIAYDDNLYGGAFRIANSWGSGWGDGGNCWISYKDLPIFSTGAYSAVPAPPAVPLLTGQVEVRFQNGQLLPVSQTKAMATRTYELSGAYPAGKDIQLYASASQSTYLYVFEVRTDGATRYVPADDSPAPVIRSGNPFVFPAADQTVTLDKALGNDYLLFLFSRQPIRDINAFTRTLQQAKGTPEQKVAAVLADQPLDLVQYTPGSMSFTITTDKASLFVPVLLRL